MAISVRRPALQLTTGLPTTDQNQKQLQEQARNRTKNIAVGVIIGLSLATGAYLGRGLIFGKTQPDHASRVCEHWFIEQTVGKGTLPSSPEFSKAHATYLNSEEFKNCIGYEKKVNEIFTKFCETEIYKTHWICV